MNIALVAHILRAWARQVRSGVEAFITGSAKLFEAYTASTIWIDFPS